MRYQLKRNRQEKLKGELEYDEKERKAHEKKAQETLSELNKAWKEGKERHDERVQVVDFQSFIIFPENTLSNALLSGSKTPDLNTTLSKTVEFDHLQLKYKNTYEVLLNLVHPYQNRSTGSTINFKLSFT